VTLFRHGNRYLSADDGRGIVESKERRLTADLMLRWNGTIAQEQDQPVFKNRHQAGREAPQAQAEPRKQDRFTVRRIRIMLSEGDSFHKMGGQDVQYLSAPTGSPADYEASSVRQSNPGRSLPPYSFGRANARTGTNRSSVGIRNIICARARYLASNARHRFTNRLADIRGK
jgi:hypothetical protein